MPNTTTERGLTLAVERNGETATIKCSGRLVFGVCDSLSVKVRELIPTSKCIVLDLTDLQQMDSMGLGTIVRLYVSAKTAGSRIVLINMGARVRQLLGVTNLLSVLTDMCEQGVNVRF
jgi:anti-sigma B factor antagonist